MCGEQTPRLLVACYRSGSSPRVRGTEGEYCVDEVVHGIIPAYVGSSWPDTGSGTSRWDHPCVCGEQPQSWAEPYRGSGSSPRMRGAAEWVPSYFDFQGIIPARAGSRTQRGLDIGSSRDHPRACGEQSWTFRDDETSVGSSPRVRGAAATHHDRAELMRIIPARAGSRDGGHPRCNRYRDHPRACGEQSDEDAAKLDEQGSSPRVRGAG